MLFEDNQQACISIRKATKVQTCYLMDRIALKPTKNYCWLGLKCADVSNSFRRAVNTEFVRLFKKYASFFNL